MIQMVLKTVIAQVLDNPDLVKEWAGKAVEWIKTQKAKRDTEQKELERLRAKVEEIDDDLGKLVSNLDLGAVIETVAREPIYKELRNIQRKLNS